MHRYDSEDNGLLSDNFKKSVFSLHINATARSAVTAMTAELVGQKNGTSHQFHLPHIFYSGPQADSCEMSHGL